MYNKIFEFCSVRNVGGAFRNGQNMPPRVVWIIKFLNSLGIDYEVDEFTSSRHRNNKFYNIVLGGSNPIAITAHHDIVNPRSQNANDNSCSIINAISTKKLSPNTTVILLDGEECGGIGSQRASDNILDGKYGNIESVLNFELTGRGGKNFFVGDYDSFINKKIISLFDPPIIRTPYNDADTFTRNGIDSTVINPLPPTEEKTRVRTKDGIYLDYSMVFNCHSMEDNVSTIDVDDMKEFVEEVVLKIIS